ncbi:MAG: GntR family transcriptional regulator [Alphaproteobacteria bacterium]
MANAIGEAIQLGEFRAGEWLRQIDLEERFGATRFDVRAALDELAVRQTIQHVPNRGYRVAAPDEGTLDGIRAVRSILEPAAAPLIVARTDDAALDRLRDLATRFGAAVRSGDHADQSRTNRDFHRALYALSGNPVLEETIWSLRARSRGAAMTRWRSVEAMVRSDVEHHEMLDALAARDAARLAAVIGRHIDGDRK